MRSLVHEALCRAVAAPSMSELADASLPPLTRAFSASFAVIYEQREDGVTSFVPRGADDPMPLYARFASRCPCHPVKVRVNPAVAVVSDMVDSHTLRRSEVFHEVFRPTGGERLLIARLGEVPFGRRGARALLLARTQRQKAWTRGDEAVLGKLRPLLGAAVERNRRAGDGERERDLLATTLEEQARAPALIFARDGRLVWASPAAVALVAARTGAAADPGAPFRAPVAALLSLERGDEPPGGLALAVQVRDLRASLFATRGRATGEPFVVVRLEDRGAVRDAVLACARRHGLSGAERAVLGALAGGAGTGEIARQLGITTATVRTHLKHIYEKLDVHSRVQALVKLREAAPG